MEKNYEISKILEDAYIIVSTTKPIMGIKFDSEQDDYKVVYMTQNRVLKKENKNIFFEEYLGGSTTKYIIRALLENKISIYNFLDKLEIKQRVVKANDKKFAPKLIESMDKYSKYLPDIDVHLESMPICSYTSLKKLQKMIDYEINIEDKLNEKYSKEEVVINERDNSGIERCSYDEIQQISIKY